MILGTVPGDTTHRKHAWLWPWGPIVYKDFIVCIHANVASWFASRQACLAPAKNWYETYREICAFVLSKRIGLTSWPRHQSIAWWSLRPEMKQTPTSKGHSHVNLMLVPNFSSYYLSYHEMKLVYRLWHNIKIKHPRLFPDEEPWIEIPVFCMSCS